jgi:hypothetical protein
VTPAQQQDAFSTLHNRLRSAARSEAYVVIYAYAADDEVDCLIDVYCESVIVRAMIADYQDAFLAMPGVKPGQERGLGRQIIVGEFHARASLFAFPQ